MAKAKRAEKWAEPVRSRAILHHSGAAVRLSRTIGQIGMTIDIPSVCAPHGCEIIPVLIVDARDPRAAVFKGKPAKGKARKAK